MSKQRTIFSTDMFLAKQNALPYHENLLAHAYKNVQPMLFVNLVTALGATFTLQNDRVWWAWSWFSAMALLTLARVAGYGSDSRWRKRTLADSAAPSDLKLWTRIYATGLWVAGGLWSLAICLWVMGSPPETMATSKYTLLIIIAALAGGATGVTAPLKTAGMVYIALLMLPGAVALATAARPDFVLAGLSVAFCAVMQVGLNNNHKVILNSFRLESTNLRLIADLQSLNNSLEGKIAERTASLRRIAHTDALTGLANRHGLMAWWKHLSASDPTPSVAVLFLDLDRFKQINDALGHDVGDTVLITTAHEIRAAIPEDGILARWGGDEFIAVFPVGDDAAHHVKKVSGDLIERVNHPFQINGETVRLGVSVGWALYPNDDKSFTDVIHAADLAATEIKRTGRGVALPYSETYAESLRRRFDLGRALGEAIGGADLTLVYQPIVDAKTEAVLAREALARWHHPVLGDIRPDEFVKLAEDTDRIIALGDWVLRQACHDAQLWRSAGDRAKVAVNVSMKQIIAADFELKLAMILAESGLAPTGLEIEVTESLFDDEHMQQVLATVTNLRQLGVAVHIDDFGTGYSSLSRLHQIPLTAIKIDKSFIDQIEGQGRVIIEGAVMIAQRFGLKVIAEGVETRAQADALKMLNVDMFQGYLFGRPSAIETSELQKSA